jgi:hypothetical protein
MKNMTQLQKLAFDAYMGISTEFSKDDLNKSIRDAITDACGGTWNWNKFLKNRYDVFALIAEMMPVSMNASLSGKFEQFAEFKDTAMGDENVFYIEDNTVYNMYTTSRGNQDIERQRITNTNFTVPTDMKLIKFYDELDRFMAGKIDFVVLNDKAAVAMGNYVGTLIYNTIYNSYASVDTEYKATGAYDADTLVSIIENVKAATGAEAVQIWGTTTALGTVSDVAGYSDSSLDTFNNLGYYGKFRGTNMFAFPQGYTAGTQTLAVNNASIIILPSAEKIVKVCFEGDALVSMTDGTNRNDLQPEILLGRRVGAAALTAPVGKYGFYKFT